MKISITRSGDELSISLRGDLNETCEEELKDLLGKIEVPAVVFDVERIELINSLGARFWIVFMNGLTKKLNSIRFKRCSPAFVESCNTYPKFVPPYTIESLFFPAQCASCGEVDPQLVGRDGFEKDNPLASTKCPKCEGVLLPAIDVEEYMQSVRG